MFTRKLTTTATTLKAIAHSWRILFSDECKTLDNESNKAIRWCSETTHSSTLAYQFNISKLENVYTVFDKILL